MIDGGAWGGSAGHLQGMAADDDNRYMYFSFTDRLIKADMRTGEIVASVTGLLAGSIYGGGAHLGDLAFYNGKVYGSLEYKAAEKFYVAVFDADKMTEMDMDYKTSGVMRTLYMDEVVHDYCDELNADEHDNAPASMGHRYGCSGIDGITFGRLPGDTALSGGMGFLFNPQAGAPETPAEGRSGAAGKTYMLLAYGVYANTERPDNDNQVILAFDPDDFDPQPFDQNAPHTVGPKPAAKYFLYTGNTSYGVQNLEYDRFTHDYWLICYPGAKEQFPNYPVYVIDGETAPAPRMLETGGHPCYAGESGLHLALRSAGTYHPRSGVWGVPVMPGSADTGFVSLGDDLFYVAESWRADDKYHGRAVLCRLDRDTCLFKAVE